MKDHILTKDKSCSNSSLPHKCSQKLIQHKIITNHRRAADRHCLIITGCSQRQHFARIQKKKGGGGGGGDFKTAFQRRYFNTAKKGIRKTIPVTANLLPLYFGMVPDAMLEAIFKKITENIRIQQHGHISTSGLIHGLPSSPAI